MDKKVELVAKPEANYAKDGGDAPCSSCANFISPDSCGLVAGAISPEATCDFYSAPEQAPLQEGSPDVMAQLFGGM